MREELSSASARMHWKLHWRGDFDEALLAQKQEREFWPVCQKGFGQEIEPGRICRVADWQVGIHTHTHNAYTIQVDLIIKALHFHFLLLSSVCICGLLRRRVCQQRRVNKQGGTESMACQSNIQTMCFSTFVWHSSSSSSSLKRPVAGGKEINRVISKQIDVSDTQWLPVWLEWECATNGDARTECCHATCRLYSPAERHLQRWINCDVLSEGIFSQHCVHTDIELESGVGSSDFFVQRWEG